LPVFLLNNLYSTPNKYRVIESRRMGLEWDVQSMGEEWYIDGFGREV